MDHQAHETAPHVHRGLGEDVRRSLAHGAPPAHGRGLLHARQREHPQRGVRHVRLNSHYRC